MSDQSNDPIIKAHTDNQLLQLVSFVVGSDNYAIPILAVQEINRVMDIKPVTKGPSFLDGAINLRGQVIPVVDLRRHFGTPCSEQTDDERIIITEFQMQGATYVIGLTVDKVSRVLRLASDRVEPTAGSANNTDRPYIQAVGDLDDGRLILLSLDKLFSQHELEQAAGAAISKTSSRAA